MYILKIEDDKGKLLLQRGITEAMFNRLNRGAGTPKEEIHKTPQFKITALDLKQASSWAESLDEGDAYVTTLELAVAVGVSEPYVYAQKARARASGKKSFTIRGATFEILR